MEDEYSPGSVLRVKLLRGSRRRFQLSDGLNQFAFCKVIVERNVRSFLNDDTWQRSATRFPLFVFHSGHSHSLARDTRRGFLFASDYKAEYSDTLLKSRRTGPPGGAVKGVVYDREKFLL